MLIIELEYVPLKLDPSRSNIPPDAEVANVRAPLLVITEPPEMTFVFDAYPPLETNIRPPEETTVSKADPVLSKIPPLDTVVEDTSPPYETLMLAPLLIVADNVLAPEPTVMIPIYFRTVL